MMSASTWINVILAALLLAVGGWAWRTRRTGAATPAAGGAGNEAPKKLDVFKRLEPVERFAIRYYITVAALICVFALSLAARKEEASGALADFLLAASVSFVVAVASTAVGCFLGFLFGIPKSLQRPAVGQPQPAPPAPSDSKDMAAAGSSSAARTTGPSFGTNTSLEEISDWLTKIIIGLGLVQFQTFLTYLYNAALFAASFIARQDVTIDTTQIKLEYQSALPSPFLFGVILACLVASCLFAYLETRTRLAQLFMEQKRDEDRGMHEATVTVDFQGSPPLTVDASDTLQNYGDESSDTLRNFLSPNGVYNDDRRKTLNGLLEELGIARDVRVILTGSENAEFRNLLIALAKKKGLLGAT